MEESVRLNPRNAEALTDLGEFYYSAPGVVGGGIDKATAVAARLQKVDAARGHEMVGRIAEQNKDYDGAEREYKQAITLGSASGFPVDEPGQLLSPAQPLGRHGLCRAQWHQCGGTG